MCELKCVAKKFTINRLEGRTPRGVCELKSYALSALGTNPSRTPRGVCELKLGICLKFVVDKFVAPREGCVS